MFYAVFFLSASVGFCWAAIPRGGMALALLWPAMSSAIVGLAYSGLGPRLFSKRPDGSLPVSTKLLLFPYLICTWLLWHIKRLVSKRDPWNDLGNGIRVGRRLLASELPDDVRTVVDLTCEFPVPRQIRERTNYVNFPVLDGTAAVPSQLVRMAEQIVALPNVVYIHCAEGRGRTGMVAAVVLLVQGRAANAAEAIQQARQLRPLFSFTPSTRKAIEEAARLIADRNSAMLDRHS